MLYNVKAHGIPKDFYPSGHLPLDYTRHAKQEARRDKFGNFSVCLPEVLDTNKAELIEVETEKELFTETYVKLVYCLRNVKGYDLFLVVRPKFGSWVVVTTWAAPRGETPRLRADKYNVPA